MKIDFSFPRFTAYLRALVITQWHCYLMFGLSLYLTMTVLSIFLMVGGVYPLEASLWGGREYFYMAGDYLNEWVLVVSHLVLFLGLAVAATGIFSLWHSPSGRLRQLLLPASALEQYIAHLLVVVLGYPILFLFAFFLADATRCAMAAVLYPQLEGVHLLMTVVTQRLLFGVGQFVCVYLLTLTFYGVGSLFFMRNAFLKMSVLLVLFVMVLVIACTQLVANGAPFHNARWLSDSLWTLAWLTVSCNVYIGYRCLKEMDIVASK